MGYDMELLAPAGNEECFFAAVNYGANAVYLGLSEFSARKNAGNFTFERLPFIISYAHVFGVKVYVAVNTVVKTDELESYFSAVGKAYEAGADAFIVQDVFFGRALKRAFPNITLHLSTQAGVNNADGAKLALSYGFSRVILARETAEAEIAAIAKIIETEVFVQGALCSSLSGHCYFSSFVGGKSGNRGACRQPCRKLYKYEGKGVSQNMRYALSLSDLNLSSKIERLEKLGVKSLKIEGRMRGFEYVSASCDYYRALLDGVDPCDKFNRMARCYNRGGYTEGLGFGQDKKLLSPLVQNHMGVAVGKVLSADGSRLNVNFNKYFPCEGDCFKILRGGKETGNATAKAVTGKDGKSQKIVIAYRGNAAAGDSVNITKDCALTEKYLSFKKKLPLEASFYAEEGKPLSLTVGGKTYYSEFCPTKAVNCPATKKEIKENLRKTDVYPFEIPPSADMGQDLFILKKAVNELRARAYKEYFYSYSSPRVISCKIEDVINDFKDFYVSGSDSENGGVTVISHDFSFMKNAFGENLKNVKNLVFCPIDYSNENEIKNFFKQIESFNAVKYLYTPAFLSGADEKILIKAAEKFDGLYVEGASGIYLAKRLNKKIFGGIELNAANPVDVASLKYEKLNEISLSKELNYGELSSLDGWTLTLGDIKIMTLIYCPFGKNCAECARGFRFKLKSDDGREFKVRRYRLSGCRFEIYNDASLFSKKRLNREIFDFTVSDENSGGNGAVKENKESKNVENTCALIEKYLNAGKKTGGGKSQEKEKHAKNARENEENSKKITAGNLIRGIE